MAKGPDAFRTISEAAAEVGVPAHVLRFWETRLSFIKPMKRAGGRRFYRPSDVAVLRNLRVLLHEQGLSLKSVQGLHRTGGARAIARAVEEGAPSSSGRAEAAAAGHPLSPPVAARLRTVLSELEAVRARVEATLGRSA